MYDIRIESHVKIPKRSHADGHPSKGQMKMNVKGRPHFRLSRFGIGWALIIYFLKSLSLGVILCEKVVKYLCLVNLRNINVGQVMFWCNGDCCEMIVSH